LALKGFEIVYCLARVLYGSSLARLFVESSSQSVSLVRARPNVYRTFVSASAFDIVAN